MATYTTNLSLTKPDTSDKVDINVLNVNFDKIDSKVGTMTADITSAKNTASSANSSASSANTKITTINNNLKNVLTIVSWDATTGTLTTKKGV